LILINLEVGISPEEISSCIKEYRLHQDIHGTSKPHKEKENKGPHYVLKLVALKETMKT
jgi:hypothetical protein